MPQSNIKITGPYNQALVMGEVVTLASVCFRDQPVVALIYGDLPDRARNGEMFRIGVVGKMGDGSASFFEKQTGVRPEIGLEAVQKPGGFADPGPPTLVRGQGDLRLSPLPTAVFRAAHAYAYDPAASRRRLPY